MLKEMKFEHFLMELRKDGIAIFAAHRPKVKNALSMAAWAELALFLEIAQRDDDVRVIIFTGSEGSFVAGMDISEIGRTDPYDASFLGASQKVGALLERGAKPVIAAVNGPAFGGGFEIALACDLRIVSETAMFALPELGIGAIPALGGTQRLCKFIGVGRAKEVLLADKRIKGQEAVDLGLAEVYSVAKAEGIDIDMLADVISTSSGNSFAVFLLRTFTEERKYGPSFAMNLVLKDLANALKINDSVPMPLTSCVYQIFKEDNANGVR